MQKFLVLIAIFLIYVNSLFALTPELVSDINPGYSPTNYGTTTAVLNNKLYFSLFAAESGSEPHIIDLVTGNISLIKDIVPGSSGSDCSNFFAFENKVFFTANNGSGTKLWQTDGTSAGTFSVFSDVSCSSLTSIGAAIPVDLVAAKLIAFSGSSPSTGNELFFYDVSTNLCFFSDIVPGANGSSPNNLTFISDPDFTGLIFSAHTPSDGVEPRFTKFFPVFETKRLADINNAVGQGSFPNNFGWLSTANKFVFSAVGPSGSGFYSCTTAVDSCSLLQPISLTSSPISLSGTKVVFPAHAAAFGTEPWVSDGTALGTTLVKDIEPGSGGSNLT